MGSSGRDFFPSGPVGTSAEGTNTFTEPTGALWSGDTFTGAGERNDFQYVTVSLQTDEPGTLFFEFSVDGTNWTTFPVAGFEIASGIHEYHAAHKAQRWFRPRFVGAGGRSFFRLYTYYTDTTVILNSPLSQGVAGDSDASTTKAVLFGQDEAGTFKEVLTTPGGDLRTRDRGIEAATTVFGTLVTSSPIPQFEFVGSRDRIENAAIIVPPVGTGGYAQGGGSVTLSTGTSVDGEQEMFSRIPLRYSAENQSQFGSTAVLSDPVDGQIIEWGTMTRDRQNGILLRRDGLSDVVMVIISGGVETVITEAERNGDALDGSEGSRFTSGDDPVSWSELFGNVYRTRFGWFGYSAQEVALQPPDASTSPYVPWHTNRYPNTAAVPHLEDPDLHIYYRVANTGATTNGTLSFSSFRGASISHPKSRAPIIFARNDGNDGSLPSGTLPTIDPVLNTEANVFDSGWIPTFNFPGGNFVNLVGDQALQVFLLNATSVAGDNMVGDGQAAIVTSPFIPATFAAPYFDEYYRIVVVNTSGSSLSSFSLHNRGHENVQQALTLGLEQTILGFFTAALSRAVNTGKNPVDGTFGNVTRWEGTDLDGDTRSAMDVNIASLTSEVVIGSLGNFNTAQTAVGNINAVNLTALLSLSGRKTLIVKNLSSTRQVAIGPSSSVTFTGGYVLVSQGDAVELDLAETGDQVWAIADSGSPRVALLEIAD